MFITLTTRLPQLKEQWHVDDLKTSGLLLLVVLAAGAGSALAEYIAGWSQSAMVLRIGFGMHTLGMGTIFLAPSPPMFVGGLAAFGLALGLVDASSNMQAVTLEYRYGRPLLPSFHGFWTAGGIVATVVTLLTSDVPVGPHLLLLLIVPVTVIFAPLVTRDRVPPNDVVIDVPWRRIMLLGMAMILFYMVDTAAQAWGPVYLRDVLDAPMSRTALATLPYFLASLFVRGIGDQLVDRFGAVIVLQVSGVVAAAALAVIVFAPTWPVAVAGFTVLGGAAATIAPLSFSAAGALAGGGEVEAEQGRVDQVIARFNQFNYVGALLGAVLTGVVGSGNLRVGFMAPTVLILGIVPLAKQFSIIRRSTLQRVLPRVDSNHQPFG